MLMLGTMKLTSFGFVELAEKFLKDALSAPPVGGGAWEFQRSVNFNDRTGSLHVLLANPTGMTKTKVSIQARQTGTQKDYSIQGWTEIPDQDKRMNFVLKESNPYRIEEEIFELVDRVLEGIPERDQSVAFVPPTPPAPKSTFAPLIPEIQTTPTEPEPTPASETTPDSFDSAQSFVDSLLSPENFDNLAATETPEGEPSNESAETGAEEPPAAEPLVTPVAEDSDPKAKAAKPAKAKKAAK